MKPRGIQFKRLHYQKRCILYSCKKLFNSRYGDIVICPDCEKRCKVKTLKKGVWNKFDKALMVDEEEEEKIFSNSEEE